MVISVRYEYSSLPLSATPRQVGGGWLVLWVCSQMYTDPHIHATTLSLSSMPLQIFDASFSSFISFLLKYFLNPPPMKMAPGTIEVSG